MYNTNSIDIMMWKKVCVVWGVNERTVAAHHGSEVSRGSARYQTNTRTIIFHDPTRAQLESRIEEQPSSAAAKEKCTAKKKRTAEELGAAPSERRTRPPSRPSGLIVTGKRHTPVTVCVYVCVCMCENTRRASDDRPGDAGAEGAKKRAGSRHNAGRKCAPRRRGAASRETRAEGREEPRGAGKHEPRGAAGREPPIGEER